MAVGVAVGPRSHPWNRDFQWHNHTGPFRALAD